jgi:DNA topoisomerase I
MKRAPNLRTHDSSRRGGKPRLRIRRRRVGRGFVYFDAAGRRIVERTVLQRISALAIPPAWEDVWVSADPRGHIQATGRDARGRKQYRYHQRWQAHRDRAKYNRALAFAARLPVLRRRVRRDLGRPGLPREKVLAAAVALLEHTLIRIGNREYARHNGSYGLTTLRGNHFVEAGSGLPFFRFRSKGGKRRRVALADSRLAKVLRRCRNVPGRELLRYRDEAGSPRAITSSDVNDYLRDHAGGDFTAKDFRTWAGTVLAAEHLRRLGRGRSRGEARRNVKRALEVVAERLGNTPTICRKSYVNPKVIDAYLDGKLRRMKARSPTCDGFFCFLPRIAEASAPGSCSAIERHFPWPEIFAGPTERPSATYSRF